MRKRILAAAFLFVSMAGRIVFVGPALAQGVTSLPFAEACNPSQAEHYDHKALRFMRAQSWNSASEALIASSISVSKCPSHARNLVWGLWWDVTEAEVLYYARVYSMAAHYLADANTLMPAARARAILTKQLASYNDSVELAQRIHNALATVSQQAAVQMPILREPAYGQYGSAPLGSSCRDDSIDTIGDDGSIIEMLSGAVYRVADVDTPTSTLWLTSEEVLICGSRIINKDNDGEAVDAERVR